MGGVASAEPQIRFSGEYADEVCVRQPLACGIDDGTKAREVTSCLEERKAYGVRAGRLLCPDQRWPDAGGPRAVVKW
jgi:hypothetical protein